MRRLERVREASESADVIVNKISVMIGGEAGAGITRSGFLFAKVCR